MKHVLVTGASSVLMQKVCKLLSQQNIECTGIARTLQNLTPEIYASWISKDLSLNIDDIDFSRFDTIIHAAACTHAFRYNQYKKINVDITKKLVLKAKSSGIRNFIFIGSRTAEENGGWYAETKLEAEKIVLSHYPNAIIIMPAEIYGGNKNEGIDAIIEKIKYKKFVFYPAGINEKLYPIALDEATQNIAEIIINNQPGSYLVNGPEGFSMLGLIHHLKFILNKKTIVLPIPKFILKIVCWLQQFLKLKIGIYPDQIKRLSVPKKNSVPPNYVRKMEDVLSIH